ncbi:MAG: GFA family protein [Pseudomonadota bacterium]
MKLANKELTMRGSCLCGRVNYEILCTPRQVVGCHCNQCRKSSGHYVAATQAPREMLKIEGLSNITWFQSSETARRGFCSTCGSQLFWTELGSDNVSVMAGTLDGTTGLTMDRQLYPETKGDYYPLPDVKTVDQSTL